MYNVDSFTKNENTLGPIFPATGFAPNSPIPTHHLRHFLLHSTLHTYFCTVLHSEIIVDCRLISND